MAVYCNSLATGVWFKTQGISVDLYYYINYHYLLIVFKMKPHSQVQGDHLSSVSLPEINIYALNRQCSFRAIVVQFEVVEP